jgi:hypothetical protein
MNERLEKNIENYFIKEIKKLGGMTIKVGKNGNPDRLALLPTGLSYLVEVKALKGKVSSLQKKVHKKIRDVPGHDVWVVRSKTTVDEFIDMVNSEIRYNKILRD